MRTLLAFVFLVCMLPFGAYAETSTGMVDSTKTISDLTLLIDQYNARIHQLEAENQILKNEMVKAGIKIPLDAFSGAIAQPIPTKVTPVSTGSISPVAVSPLVPTVSSEVVMKNVSLQYGSGVAGFITRIHSEWSAIRDAYSLPKTASIGGYEFIMSGNADHVFVDIMYPTSTGGIYDAKILYQFEKQTFKRKLVGFFEYNRATQKYTTKTGSNPFTGIARTFVLDPYFSGATTLPVTASSSPTSSSTIAPTSTGSTIITQPSSIATVADIEKAYQEKRYLSVISLSNSYLTTNAPTVDILRIRYRTYFIIGKYTESLSEIGKIQALGKLDKAMACDAQVIATYSKNTSLVSQYAATCSKK